MSMQTAFSRKRLARKPQDCELHHTYLPIHPNNTKNRHILRPYHVVSYEWEHLDDSGDYITVDGPCLDPQKPARRAQAAQQ